MSSRQAQQRPSDAQVLAGRFSRGPRSYSFGEIAQRSPARFRTDETVPGYQNRLLDELANFRNQAESYRRLKEGARREKERARDNRLLDLAAEFKKDVLHRREQEWLTRIRTNLVARILGLPGEFEPEEPEVEEEEWWRISKLREWSARVVKRRTPTPYAEIRVYVFTQDEKNPLYTTGSFEEALDAVEVWLTTGLDSRPTHHGEEREEIDADELEQENLHQDRGGADMIRPDQVWFYVAFWKMPDLTEPKDEYYGRVRSTVNGWRADRPKAFTGRKPSFGTPFTSVWQPPFRG